MKISRDLVKNILDISSLEETFISANTPLYIYKNFRKNNSIQNLAEMFDSDYLIKLFNTLVREKRKDLETLIFIYSVIIALTFKDYFKVKRFFSKLDAYRLEWSKELKEIVLTNSKITQMAQVNKNYKIDGYYDFAARNSANMSINKNINMTK